MLDADKPAVRTPILTRRQLLQIAFTAGSVVGIAAEGPVIVLAAERQQDGRTQAASPRLALRLAQFLNRTRYQRAHGSDGRRTALRDRNGLRGGRPDRRGAWRR